MADNAVGGAPIAEVSSPFQPNPLHLLRMPLFQQNHVPRYLFRVHTPKTAGKTDAACVIPPASTCGKTDRAEDIFRLQPRTAAALLNAHLRWQYSHELECNLISWTSSLLFALQYGLYRHHASHDKSDLSHIFLLIIDTRRFPKGTFVKDLEIMEVFARYSDASERNNLENLLNFRKNDMGYYFGEYLTQGDLTIQGTCVQTTMQRMVDSGLFELNHELGDESKWDQWAKRVVNLRGPFRALRDAPPATHAEVRKAIAFAEVCFGACWVVPLAAMLLALKCRKNNDAVITEGFVAMFAGKSICAWSNLARLLTASSGGHRQPVFGGHED